MDAPAAALERTQPGKGRLPRSGKAPASQIRSLQLSDSFPGLLALVTGGSPVTTGLFYDVSYDRAIFDPTNTTCTGGAGNIREAASTDAKENERQLGEFAQRYLSKIMNIVVRIRI